MSSPNDSVARNAIAGPRSLPPIPIDDWTLDNLTERIAGVRQQYVDILADWPGKKA